MFRALGTQLRRARWGLAARRLSPCDRLERVDLSALLNRPAVNLDTPELQRFLAGKRVMVTGAGGSIGSEICRQIMRFCPNRLALVEQAENALFEIDAELRQRWVGMQITPHVADICDAMRINNIFESERPQVIFHCAAHKHVPMMEMNPGEAIKNNVFGTKVLADAAIQFGAAAFVMVSTDKAVNPTSVMGATKRVAEMYVQSLNGGQQAAGSRQQNVGSASADRLFASSPACDGRQHLNGGQQAAGSRQQNVGSASADRLFTSGGQARDGRQHNDAAAGCPLPAACSTRFVAVRFGNVLGSSGSVIPIFKKQIAAGGPVTVTHPDMKRYFMTIPEASQLVLQAGAIANGGEVFVLDMGQPVRILDLARDMIRRAGLREGDDIDIQFTGIRPGEKLYEELACTDEQTQPTRHDKIRAWRLTPIGTSEMHRILDLLKAVRNAPRDQVIFALQQSVPEYRPTAPANEPSITPIARDQATNLRLLAQQAARAA